MTRGSSACTIDGCAKPTFARTWCQMHYGRWQRHGSTDPKGYHGDCRSLDIVARIAKYSERRGDCVVWTGRVDPDGYGMTRNGGAVSVRVHRVVYEMAKGAIPDGLVVRHKCDNPPCILLEHLELGTNRDNVDDRHRRGRDAIGARQGSAKLDPVKVREIRALLAAGYGQVIIARRYGVRPFAIQKIRDGKTWRWVE